MSPITHPAEVNALVVEHLRMAATCVHPPVVVAASLPTGSPARPREPGQDCSQEMQVLIPDFNAGR
jgi:hypothetical protein